LAYGQTNANVMEIRGMIKAISYKPQQGIRLELKVLPLLLKEWR
jgi:hypothetical protein